jgi:hypothetical protein
MRTTLAGILALLVWAGATDHAAAQTLGVVGGLNMSSIKGDAPDKVKWGGKTGLVLGLVGEFRLAEDVYLLLQPTLTKRGSSLGVEVEGQEEPVDSGSVSLDYVTLPVLVKVMAGNGRTFVTSGLDFGILTGATFTEGSNEEDVKDRLEDFDVAVNFGFGGIVFAGRPNVSLELRYSQSLMNLANSTTTEEALPVRFRSSGFQLIAGVLLPLGGGR